MAAPLVDRKVENLVVLRAEMLVEPKVAKKVVKMAVYWAAGLAVPMAGM